MAERVHPSTKTLPTTTKNTAPSAVNNPSFPPSKAQRYGATRPAYRRTPPQKSRRSCCCLCFLWTTILLLTLIVLAGIFGAVVYIMYSPHLPTFNVSSLKVTTLNLTSSSQLITNIELNVTTRNPNTKVIIKYNPIRVSILTNDNNDVVLGSGEIPSFVHGKKNTTMLSVSLSDDGSQQLDDGTASKLRSEMKSKSGVEMKLELDTKVKVKMGFLNTPKVGIRVDCVGIKGFAPSGKSPSTASVSNAKCNIDMRFKIWRWTF